MVVPEEETLEEEVSEEIIITISIAGHLHLDIIRRHTEVHHTAAMVDTIEARHYLRDPSVLAAVQELTNLGESFMTTIASEDHTMMIAIVDAIAAGTDTSVIIHQEHDAQEMTIVVGTNAIVVVGATDVDMSENTHVRQDVDEKTIGDDVDRDRRLVLIQVPHQRIRDLHGRGLDRDPDHRLRDPDLVPNPEILQYKVLEK